MLTCYAKTIPGRGWRVRLEVQFLGILEASTDPSGLKLLKITIFVNLDGQDPSTGNIVIDLVLSSVTILHPFKWLLVTKNGVNRTSPGSGAAVPQAFPRSAHARQMAFQAVAAKKELMVCHAVQ